MKIVRRCVKRSWSCILWVGVPGQSHWSTLSLTQVCRLMLFNDAWGPGTIRIPGMANRLGWWVKFETIWASNVIKYVTICIYLSALWFAPGLVRMWPRRRWPRRGGCWNLISHHLPLGSLIQVLRCQKFEAKAFGNFCTQALKCSLGHKCSFSSMQSVREYTKQKNPGFPPYRHP